MNPREVWPCIVEYSAMFDGADDRLSRLAGTTPGDRTRFTVFASVKRAGGSTTQTIVSAGMDSLQSTSVSLADDGQLLFIQWAASTNYQWRSFGKLDDQTGHYHVLVAVDTSFADPNDRIRVQVNGVDMAGEWTSAIPQDFNAMFLGRQTDAYANYYGVGFRAALPEGYYLPGYLSNVHYIDGQLLDSSDFGRFSSVVRGLWTYTGYEGTHGVHGFHLDFADGADLGKDVSGNGNHLTTYGAPAQSIDTPTCNQLAWNADNVWRVDLYNINRDVLIRDGPGGCAFGTMTIPSGKYCFGVDWRGADEKKGSFGVRSSNIEATNRSPSGAFYGYAQYLELGSRLLCADGDKTIGALARGAVYVVGVDLDNNTCSFYDASAVLKGTVNIAPGCLYTPFAMTHANDVAMRIGLVDETYYTVPEGFMPLCADTLPEDEYSLSGEYLGHDTSLGVFVQTNCALESVTVEGTTYHNDGSAASVVRFLSTGFKLVGSEQNASGTTYSWTGTLRYPAKYANAQIN